MAFLPFISRSVIQWCSIHPDYLTKFSFSIRFWSTRKIPIVNGPSEEEIYKNESDKNRKFQNSEQQIINSKKFNLEGHLNPIQNALSDILPRFDELFYKATDKAKRKYAITWPVNRKIKYDPKFYDNFETFETPFRKRTTPKPNTARSVKENFMETHRKMTSRSFDPALNYKPVRKPPKFFFIPRKPTLPTNRITTPYPAFSESTLDRKTKVAPYDLHTLPPLCKIWSAYRHKVTKRK